MNINVAIRLRPFNNRELSLKSKLCVEMNDQSVKLRNNEGKVVKKFSFDHCFWSHDEFKVDIMGYYKAKDQFSRYADQNRVYSTLG